MIVDGKTVMAMVVVIVAAPAAVRVVVMVADTMAGWRPYNRPWRWLRRW